jgi:hypothetical protein
VTFASATASHGDVWDVPDGWQQGRGAWGGLVVAAAVRHAQSCAANRTIRSVSAHLMAPVPVGLLTITSQALRTGSAMTTVRTTMVDSGGTQCVDAVSIWSTDRAMDIEPPFAEWGVAAMPAAPRWQDVPVAPVAPPLGPVFATHLEYRVIDGVPLSGSSRILGWIDVPESHEQWDAAHLLGLVDAWWPVAIAKASSIRPMATVAFAAQLLMDPAHVPTDAPLLHEAFATKAAGGFIAETRRLWTADGHLVVENLQSIAIIA